MWKPRLMWIFYNNRSMLLSCHVFYKLNFLLVCQNLPTLYHQFLSFLEYIELLLSHLHLFNPCKSKFDKFGDDNITPSSKHFHSNYFKKLLHQPLVPQARTLGRHNSSPHYRYNLSSVASTFLMHLVLTLSLSTCH
jgi:hypothetical protein